jgi:hypothetical protein
MEHDFPARLIAAARFKVRLHDRASRDSEQ